MLMTAQRRLDRTARTAIAAAVALILAGPAFLVAKHVAAKLGERSEQLKHPHEDQLVALPNGSTLLVKKSSIGHRIAEWLKLGTKGEKTFQVGNANFAPDSTALTHDGWEHLGQFAHMLNAYHDVRAVILFSAYHGNPATVQLEHMRADRIHGELLKDGVDKEQVAVAPEGFEAGHNAARDDGLEVVLTHKT